MASIYLRKSVWWITYYVDGRRVQHSLKVRDRRHALHLKKQKEIEIEQGKAKILQSIKTSDVLAQYQQYSFVKKCSQAHREDLAILRSFISSAHAFYIKDIKTATIQKYLQKLSTSGRKPKTVNNHLIVIHTFLNFARSQEYIFDNPAASIKKLTIEKNPPRFLSAEETERLISVSQKSHLYPMIMTAIYTGMRMRELMHLEWQDIDFDRKTVTVRNKAGFQTKNRKFRVIPLSSQLAAVLKPLKAKSGYCFTYKGKPYRSRPKKALETLFKRSQIRNAGWHTFRKTFASHLIMQGISITKVSKWLGHSSPVLTFQTYAHLSPQTDSEIESLTFSLHR